MTNCTFCKGDLHDALTTFTIDLDSCIVIIRNVPSQVCSQCGEPYYSTDVMQQLYKIAESVRNSMTEVAIVNYHPLHNVYQKIPSSCANRMRELQNNHA